jgi:tetratricopeptide (TPR) repeat protein
LDWAQSPAPSLVPLETLKIPETKETSANADQPQALGLGGTALFGMKDEKGEIAAARAEMQKDPGNPNRWIALGQLQDSFLRYRESVDTYSSGIAKFPADWRFLRYRGQRRISLRSFSEAIQDLEAAREKTKKSYEVAYYLGLAYYFSGAFAKAAAEFGRCEDQMKQPLPGAEDLYGQLSCESARENQALVVPLVYWRYLALRRDGKNAEAKAYADSVSPLWTLTTNKAFYDALLYFRGTKEIGEMMEGANEGTRDFLVRSTGVAAHLFGEGERQRACSIWQRNVMDTKWSHLGVIAAEAEFYRNSRAACALYGSVANAPSGSAAAPKPPL